MRHCEEGKERGSLKNLGSLRKVSLEIWIGTKDGVQILSDKFLPV